MGEEAEDDVMRAISYDDRDEDMPRATKGELGGECNRSACDIWPATFWNPNTRRYYCPGCARRINDHISADQQHLRCMYHRDPLALGQPPSEGESHG